MCFPSNSDLQNLLKNCVPVSYDDAVLDELSAAIDHNEQILHTKRFIVADKRMRTISHLAGGLNISPKITTYLEVLLTHPWQ